MSRVDGQLRRVGFTLTAQVYNQFVTVVVQLAQVPLLLTAWGASRYGGWLVLYAIPSYLTLTDFGFTVIAKNNMVMAAAAGNREAVTSVYHSVFALVLVASIGVGAVAAVGIGYSHIGQALDLGPISEASAKVALAALVANVVLNQFFLLLCAGVRASGRPAAEVVWGATGRLAEGAAIVAAAWASTDVAHAAVAILAARSVCLCALWGWLRVVASDIRLGLDRATLPEIRAMANPALSYTLLGLAQAMVIQGPVILLGAVATATDAAAFSTLRTLARLGTSAANVVNFSIFPEYTRLYGAGSLQAFARLERYHLAVGGAGIALYCAGLAMIAPWVAERWTHGQIAVAYPLFGLLMLSVAAEMFWSCRLTPLTAINRHVRLSYIFVGVVAVCAPLAWVGATHYGATGIATALLVVYGAMSILISALRPPGAFATGEKSNGSWVQAGRRP
jgi:O-antigen/teichoic acid export membrane protein